jgi:DNA-binding NtrC family response regulator
MIAYDWPGNVRQLRNEIERVVAYAADGARVAVTDLSPELLQQRRLALPGRFGSTSQAPVRADRPVIQDGWSSREAQNGSNNGDPVNLKEATAVLERQLILEALERNRNNLSRTASELGLSRRGLRLKLAQLGIPRGESEVSAGVGIRS